MGTKPPVSRRVVTSHTAQYLDPIRLRLGDPVEVGRADDEWEG